MSESKFKTMRHIETVRNYLGFVIKEFIDRQQRHDQSKLEPPEVDYFEEFTPKLRGLTYGSDEYRECLRQMRPAIVHHNEHNSHHPEHYNVWFCDICAYQAVDGEARPESRCPRCNMAESKLQKVSGIYGMDLFDLMEMLCDWKAAGMRHDDGDIMESLRINKERFEIGPQLDAILRNTVERYIKPWPVPNKANES